jgi:hypothetical protein
MNAVKAITHIGAPAAMSGSAASCAEPAYTTKVISKDCQSDKPDCIMAAPVTTYYAPTAVAVPLYRRGLFGAYRPVRTAYYPYY